MSKVFHKLFYHTVWSTYRREPIITLPIEKALYPFLENKTKRFNCSLHAIGGMDDHIHIILSMPPAESISDIVGKLKGSSSYFLNKELQITNDFAWQEGYSVLSFAERDMKNMLRYVQNQKNHHSEKNLNAWLEGTDVDE